jgi:hypothetical protein
MKTIRIFKRFFINPIVFGVIVLVCVYAYFTSENKVQKIAKGFTATVCVDSSQKVLPTLREIISEQDPENYLKLAKGLTDIGDYPGRSIPNGTSVTVIDTLESHSEIVQVYIYRENPTSVNPRNEYLWIWEGYICR